jgi:hypothetical protein
MDKSEFWRVVDLAGKQNNLHGVLMTYNPTSVLDYYVHFQERMHESHSGDLYAAATLLNAGYRSDDSFEYFKCWLISKGRATFEQALLDADTLAEVEVPMPEGKPEAENEDFCYVAFKVYKEKTGEDLFAALDRLGLSPMNSNPDTFDWAFYTDEVIQRRLPRLWKKYSKYFITESEYSDDRPNTLAVEISGIGVVRVGDIILHTVFGTGSVEEIIQAPLHAARIRFSDSEHVIVLDDPKRIKKVHFG